MKTTKKTAFVIASVAGMLLLSSCSAPTTGGNVKESGKQEIVEVPKAESNNNENSGLHEDASVEVAAAHAFTLDYFDTVINNGEKSTDGLMKLDDIYHKATGFTDPAGALPSRIPGFTEKQQETLQTEFDKINTASEYNADNIESTSDKAVFSLMNLIYNAKFGMIPTQEVAQPTFYLDSQGITVAEDGNTANVDLNNMKLTIGKASGVVATLSETPNLPLVKIDGAWKVDSAKLLGWYKEVMEKSMQD